MKKYVVIIEEPRKNPREYPVKAISFADAWKVVEREYGVTFPDVPFGTPVLIEEESTGAVKTAVGVCSRCGRAAMAEGTFRRNGREITGCENCGAGSKYWLKRLSPEDSRRIYEHALEVSDAIVSGRFEGGEMNGC